MTLATRILIALLICILVSASHLLDGSDEITSAELVAADLADAIADARHAAHRPE